MMGHRAVSRFAPGGRGPLATRLLTSLALAVAMAGQAMAAPFAVTNLGTLVATGINDVGQVVGHSATADGATHAFLWQDGTMIDLGTLNSGAGDSYASGINSLGQVVGYSVTAGGTTHAFLWYRGTMTDLNSLIPADSGWELRVATAINQTGLIVGWGMHGLQPRAFLWQTGGVTDLGTLGGDSSSATAINDVGQVVGMSDTADGSTHAFLWQYSTMIDLGTLNSGAGDSYASGINNLGQVVGTSASDWVDDGTGWGSNLPHAFLWQNGWLTDLHYMITQNAIAHESYAVAINDSGQIVGNFSDGLVYYAFFDSTPLQSLVPADSGFWFFDAASAINNAGQIVGTGTPSGGGTRAFLLTPSPFVSLTLNPTTVLEQNTSTGTVTLTTAAPEGGAAIALSSSNSAIATVPATVIVPAGATSATFSVSTNSAPASTSVTISATYAGFTVSATLIVTPTLATISLNPTSVTAGSASIGTVTLTTAAPEGGAVIALSSSNSAIATVPATVIVPAGATSATFSVSTNSASASTSVTISATYARVTVSATLIVTPTLATISLNPTSVTAGSPSTGTVTISAPAPAGGAVITLSSNNTVAAVPTSVTVAAGATSTTFSASTTSLTTCAASVATISATYGDVTRSAGLTVTPTTDTVTIQQADYFAGRRQLRVGARSTGSAATLRVYVTSTGALIGTLQNLGDGRYTGQFTWPVSPQSITVRSSLCGSATKTVTSK